MLLDSIQRSYLHHCFMASTYRSIQAFKHVPVLHNLGWKVRVGATIGSGILAYAIAGYSLGVKNKALINKIIS